MERLKKKQAGITLIALVISIIVMLILAGVSINATIGENGIVTQAQKAILSEKYARYKEELEIDIASNMMKNGIENRDSVNALNEYVKGYITSFEDLDVGKFGIVKGELYYLGGDTKEKSVATNLGIQTFEGEISLEEIAKEIEEDAIEAILKTMTGDSFKTTDSEGNSTEVGVKLYNKSLENSTRWKMITEVKDGVNTALYGTGWYYVEAGNTVDGLGELKQSYIIDYENRKAVKFDATKHTMLSWNSALAVSDGLIFTVDPAIIESGYAGDSSWREGIDVYGYNSNYSDTFTNVSMKFDGENDYIQIPASLANVATKGFTYEFYGKPTGYGYYLRDITDATPDENGNYSLLSWCKDDFLHNITNNDGRTSQVYDTKKITGILSFGKVNYGESSKIKFLFRYDSIKETLAENQIGNIYFNYGYGSAFKEPKLDENGNIEYNEDGEIVTKVYSTEFYNEILETNKQTCDTITPWATYKWCDSPTDYWNQCLNLTSHDMKTFFGEEMYYAIVIDPEADTQSVYVNGELVESVQLNTRAWKYTVQYLEEKGNNGYWFVGRATEGSPEWAMFKGDIYTLRIYEGALTRDQLKANYNTTVAYHDFLVNGSSTGGNTGGEDY